MALTSVVPWEFGPAVKSIRCTACRLEKAAYCYYAKQRRCIDCGRISALESWHRRKATESERWNAAKRSKWASDPAYRARLRARNTAYKRRRRAA